MVFFSDSVRVENDSLRHLRQSECAGPGWAVPAQPGAQAGSSRPIFRGHPMKIRAAIRAEWENETDEWHVGVFDMKKIFPSYVTKRMAKKSKEIKFTQDEISRLKELQQDYDNVRSSLGSIEVSRIQTEARLEQIHNEKLRLETQYTQLNQRELELVSELNQKYGPGNLDPLTGVFTPTK